MAVNNRVFDMMTAAADKTNVDIIDQKEDKKVTSKDIHTALLAAGMTPGYGNIADMADAILYAAEGEFGEAALSMAAMIPIVGQIARVKKIQKGVGSLPSSVQKKLFEADYIPTWISHGGTGPRGRRKNPFFESEQKVMKRIINERTKRGRKMLEEMEKGEKILKEFGIDL